MYPQRPKKRPGYCPAVQICRLSPDGKTVVGAANSNVNVWDVASCSLVRTLAGPACRIRKGMMQCVTAADISPDSKQILSGAYGSWKLWNARTGEPNPKCCSFSPDGWFFVFGGSCGDLSPIRPPLHLHDSTFFGHADTMKLRSTSTGHCLRTFDGHRSVPACFPRVAMRLSALLLTGL
jgi:WD40 repeat protein